MDTSIFLSYEEPTKSKRPMFGLRPGTAPQTGKTMSQCDFRPITNSNFGDRITAARWKLLKVIQMQGIRILSQCHYMCLLRCTFSAMFKLNKTLNDCVV